MEFGFLWLKRNRKEELAVSFDISLVEDWENKKYYSAMSKQTI
jgi:hypothetical protein